MKCFVAIRPTFYMHSLSSPSSFPPHRGLHFSVLTTLLAPINCELSHYVNSQINYLYRRCGQTFSELKSLICVLRVYCGLGRAGVECSRSVTYLQREQTMWMQFIYCCMQLWTSFLRCLKVAESLWFVMLTSVLGLRSPVIPTPSGRWYCSYCEIDESSIEQYLELVGLAPLPLGCFVLVDRVWYCHRMRAVIPRTQWDAPDFTQKPQENSWI